ncbi:hypothetical protein PR048_002464 [Dryococelus australis]|uniref:Uncharacterized protein n=1 Tax=Dryococelus australis TaxID=614101 RepID=A0ABQ9IK87_9NEOP|nr:hypothetical protein PR048_002464 [Dryococelus australis]
MEQSRNERAGETGDPRETRQLEASYGTIITCENPECIVRELNPVRLERSWRWSEGEEYTEDPRENPSTSGIVRHDSHIRKSDSNPEPPASQIGGAPTDCAIGDRLISVTTVAERLSRSPRTKANRFQSPAGSPDFRKRESCRTMSLVGGFSRGSPVSPAPSLRRCSILTSITLIGSQDVAAPAASCRIKTVVRMLWRISLDELVWFKVIRPCARVAATWAGLEGAVVSVCASPSAATEDGSDWVAEVTSLQSSLHPLPPLASVRHQLPAIVNFSAPRQDGINCLVAFRSGGPCLPPLSHPDPLPLS